jgi:hypothetical protein
MPSVKIPARQRSEVIRRAHGCCEYCLSQEKFSPDPFSIEHVIPLAKGGSNEISNLALSCQGCNNFKHVATEAIDPMTGNKVSLFHPRVQVWSEHFAWNDDYSLILALTSTGRATVDKLQLNRLGLVNLRRVLAAVELHPPRT